MFYLAKFWLGDLACCRSSENTFGAGSLGVSPEAKATRHLY